jgi:TM2 domain-containing membrane protein YozV
MFETASFFFIVDTLKKKAFLLFILFIFCSCFQKAIAQDTAVMKQKGDTLQSIELIIDATNENSIAKDSILKKDTTHLKPKKKKWIAAVLAFPFPFGVVGLHRVYLGTAPYIPLLYVATIGGGFGLLPLADFIAILNSNEEDLQNFNSEKAFFWIKP